MAERWLEETAEQFWAAAGNPGPFPRDLEAAVLWALPLAVFKLPRLWVSDVQWWLAERGVRFRLETGDRPLRGCQVAHGGRGCVLLNGADSPAELRFSLAHETAHFLLDYHQPRLRAIKSLGDEILPALDGLRPLTVNERVHGILSGVSLGLHTHLMERRPDGVIGCGHTAWAEVQADRLALELLAPEAAVWTLLSDQRKPRNFAERVCQVQQALLGTFGLPPEVALPYGDELARRWYGGPSFREWLGIL